MTTQAPIPKAGILSISPYVAGDSKLAGIDQVVKLSSNEGALGPSPKAIAAFAAAGGELHRYPDGSAKRLRQALAARWGLDAERIVCGNGSDDVLQLLARAFAGSGDEVLYSQHGFLIYPICAKSCGATPVAAPEVGLTASVDNLLAAVTPRTRIVYLANPNNPTGTYLSGADLRRLHAGLRPDILLVVDAAYAEFVERPDYEDGAALVDSHANVVMTRTFSKIYALGGLRLGWAYCPAAIADALNRIRGPFNVSLPALAAGEAALEDRAFVDLARRHNATWRDWLTAETGRLGLMPVPGVGNFLLLGFPADEGRNAAAADAFLRQHGVIVRAVGGYGLPNHLRITIGREDEVRLLARLLAEFVAL